MEDFTRGTDMKYRQRRGGGGAEIRIYSSERKDVSRDKLQPSGLKADFRRFFYCASESLKLKRNSCGPPVVQLRA